MATHGIAINPKVVWLINCCDSIFSWIIRADQSTFLTFQCLVMNCLATQSDSFVQELSLEELQSVSAASLGENIGAGAGGAVGAQLGARAGAAIGSIGGFVGMVIGAGVGAGLGWAVARAMSGSTVLMRRV
jgi:hypothetical protein